MDPAVMDKGGEPKKFSFDYSYWSHNGFKEKEDGYLEPTTPKYADQVREGILCNKLNQLQYCNSLGMLLFLPMSNVDNIKVYTTTCIWSGEGSTMINLFINIYAYKKFGLTIPVNHIT